MDTLFSMLCHKTLYALWGLVKNHECVTKQRKGKHSPLVYYILSVYVDNLTDMVGSEIDQQDRSQKCWLTEGMHLKQMSTFWPLVGNQKHPLICTHTGYE